MTTRAEHIDWARARARIYLERGECMNALRSMSSDLGKHPETQGHGAIDLGHVLALAGRFHGTEALDWLEGIQ